MVLVKSLELSFSGSRTEVLPSFLTPRFSLFSLFHRFLFIRNHVLFFPDHLFFPILFILFFSFWKNSTDVFLSQPLFRSETTCVFMPPCFILLYFFLLFVIYCDVPNHVLWMLSHNTDCWGLLPKVSLPDTLQFDFSGRSVNIRGNRQRKSLLSLYFNHWIDVHFLHFIIWPPRLSTVVADGGAKFFFFSKRFRFPLLVCSNWSLNRVI